MGDGMKRSDADRALFGVGNRQQLVELVKQADPHLVAGAITRALELQIVAEEIAREQGLEIDDDKVREYLSREAEDLGKQLDRAVNAFICSIVSQEG